jgi:hypothetical protein
MTEKRFYISDPDTPRHPDDVPIPVAHSMTVVDCGDPDCEAAHILLLDENGNPMAQATVGLKLIAKMYIIATQKELINEQSQSR